MKFKERKVVTILAILLATILFTFLRRINLFNGLVNILVERGWSLLMIQIAAVIVESIFAAVAVLLVMPPLLGFKRGDNWLRAVTKLDVKTILLGLFSFGVFALLGFGIASALGIFIGDPSVVFAWPDIRPDPDVVGFGYFLLALVPGVWEELAFRGLILTRLQARFKPGMAIFFSAFFFAIFHFSSLVVQPLSEVIGGVIMAFFFGLAWGVMKVRTGSVLPAILSHYLVDSMGAIFLNVDATDPVKVTQFFLLLSLGFSVLNIILSRIMVPNRNQQTAEQNLSFEVERS